ncbi:putative quinol monooxygenase [Agromyces ramosus]|uniref:Quinol monooxygenase YgiN n=1 Tax=Agromyces ramosus TaxID=33879 RepID=A0ABU0R7Y6_9MICO|nr:antibiotic biosynthesis monooxygenase [Agromyces ramosus]MDQ0894200.1 quinol monooxygenase YgiN [Agromyces ramosus]
MSRASADERVELVAEFTAVAGREEEVERLLLALAAEVRREPGCLDFSPHRVAAPPAGSAATAGPAPIGTRFVVTEAYRDASAFAAHLAAPYGAPFNAALVPLIVEDGSVLTFLRPLA